MLLILMLTGSWLSVGPALAAGVVPLALGGLAGVVSPNAAVAATLMALPLVFRPVVVAGQSFALSELSIVCGAAGLAIRLAWSLGRSIRRQPARDLLLPWTVTLPVSVLFAVATLSLLTVADPAHRHESLREYRVVIVEPLLFLGLARHTVRIEWGARLASTTFVLTGAIIGAIALGQVILRSGVAADAVVRAHATYPHPNNLAFFLERGSLFGFGWASLDRRWRRRLLPVALLAGAGAAATLSRGAGLALAVGAALVVLRLGSRRAWSWYLVSLLIGVTSFALLAQTRLFASGARGTEPTRLLIWQGSLRMIQDHPVFGVGLDQFLYQYWRHYVAPAGWPERYTSHPHNIVLDIWLRLGLLGLLVSAWLTTAISRVARRRPLSNEPGDAGRALGAAAALVGGLAHGLVDNAFFLPDLAIMTWFFVALLETRPGRQRPRPSLPTSRVDGGPP